MTKTNQTAFGIKHLNKDDFRRIRKLVGFASLGTTKVRGPRVLELEGGGNNCILLVSCIQNTSVNKLDLEDCQGPHNW